MSNYVQLGELKQNDSFVKIVNRKLGSTIYKVLHQNVSGFDNHLSTIVENQDTKEVSSFRNTHRVSKLTSLSNTSVLDYKSMYIELHNNVDDLIGLIQDVPDKHISKELMACLLNIAGNNISNLVLISQYS